LATHISPLARTSLDADLLHGTDGNNLQDSVTGENEDQGDGMKAQKNAEKDPFSYNWQRE